MWKERVNALLTKTTGYQLQKADAPAAPPPPGAAPGSEKAPKEKSGGGSADKKRSFPAHYDENAIRVIERVTPRTMTGKEKLFGLILATRYLAENSVPGDFVECGVWRGGSMQAAALTLIEEGDTRRDLHLFDTFEGMSEPTEKDRRNDGKAASELLAGADKNRRVWAFAGLEDVKEGMAELDYPQDQIHFHRGMVEETIPEKAPGTIAMLRLDTDWYESTRHELEHLYDRLSPGGVLILDDYGHWEGARLAAQEFMKEHGSRLALLPLGSGRIAIKPWA
jgi:O-methyltransferase